MRILIAFLITGLAAFGQITSPANLTVVKQGQTQSITSAVPVTWSLAAGSVGTLTTIDSKHATYTAPDSVTPGVNLYGCTMPPDHVYTTRIDTLPVHPNNTALMASLVTSPVTLQFSIDFPGNTATNATPTVNINGIYSNPPPAAPVTVSMVPLKDRQQEGGSYHALLNDTNSDHHLISVNKDSCQAFEQYQYYLAGANPLCLACTSQSVMSYPVLSGTLPPVGIDAAGMPSQPLTVKATEIRSGMIPHAMRFSTHYVGGGYEWPATASASGPGAVKYGTRFRLKSTFDATAGGATCSTKSNPAYCSAILTALKNYGTFAVDGTMSGIIDNSGEGDMSFDPDLVKILRELSGAINITTANFEAVDQSSLRDTSYGAPAGLEALAPPTLARNATIVLGTAITGGAVSKVRIINQGAAIGFDAHNFYRYIQSGATTTFTANVTGLSSTAVTWSMSPGVGTLNASTGVYTAPTVTNPTTTTITATSTVDNSVSGSFVVNVTPPLPLFINFGGLSSASSSPGSIVGGNYVDGSGRTWYTNYLEPSFYANGSNDNSARTIVNTTGYDIFPIFSEAYYLGDSIVMTTMKPGNYLVQPIMYWPFTAAQIGSPLVDSKLLVDIQGQLVARGVDLVRDTFNQSTNVITPVAPIYPATVGADGRFYFSLRKYGSIYSGPAKMAGLVIKADPGSPHITIDNPDGPGSNVGVGTAHNLYCVGWQMAGGCTFTITSGSGTITTVDGVSATYTAPNIPPPVASPQTVTITATSNVDSTKTATTTFIRVFGTLTANPAYSTLTQRMSQQITAKLDTSATSRVTWTASKGIITSTGFWTAPAASADTSATITATSIDDGTQIASTTVNISASPASMFIALGTNFNTTDTAGNVWVGKDLTTYVPQGQSVSVACTESGVAGNCSGYGDDSATIAGVSDAAQMPIYRHAIYGNPYSTPKGDLAVKFSVPPGIYHVTLKFADYNASYEPGVLVQDILANGRKIYRSFDFVTAAGAPQTAVDRTFTVNHTAGVLTLQFNHAANGRPHINAISVVYAGSLPEGQTAISGASASKGIGIR